MLAVAALGQLVQGQEIGESTFSNTSETIVNDSVGLDHKESCPNWHLWNNEEKKCVCRNVNDVVKCNPETSAVSLAYGYCMTFDNDTGKTHLGKCSYTLFSRHNESWYTVLPRSTDNLNEVMCGEWYREGYLCSQCKKGYGLTTANLYMRCVKCSWNEGVAWLVFFLVQLIPVTVLFAVVTMFRLSITRPPMNGFVLFSQVSLAILYLNSVRFQTPFLSSSASSVFLTLRNIYLPILSLWSLTFSHVSKLTNFCVNSHLVHQQSYLLHFITNIHVMLLIVVAYVLIELHARNYRIVVWLWKPFYTCFVRSSRAWNPRLSTVDTFATFLLLSYTRFILLSYFIYAFQRVSTLAEPIESQIVLQYNPKLKYFDHAHLPYVTVSLLILLILVLTPAIVLALYQTRPLASCFKCLRLNKMQSLHIFIDLFHGHYKDGTSGTRDLRFTASLYIFLRLALLLALVLCNYSDFLSCDVVAWLVLLTATLLFMVVAQPYKNGTMNTIDIVLLIMLVLIISLLAAVSQSVDTTVNAIVLSFILILVAIPQVVFYSFLVYKLSRIIRGLYFFQRNPKKCQICCHKVHHGSREDLTTSQINNSILRELSTGRFDSSYQEDFLLSDDNRLSAAYASS